MEMDKGQAPLSDRIVQQTMELLSTAVLPKTTRFRRGLIDLNKKDTYLPSGKLYFEFSNLYVDIYQPTTISGKSKDCLKAFNLQTLGYVCLS